MSAQPDYPPIPPSLMRIPAPEYRDILQRLTANLPGVPAAKVEAAFRAACVVDRPAPATLDHLRVVPTVGEVLHRVALYWSLNVEAVTEADILGRAQGGTVGTARCLTYWMLRYLMSMSSVRIGQVMGRDHSSVLSGLKTAVRWAEGDEALLRTIAATWVAVDPTKD